MFGGLVAAANAVAGMNAVIASDMASAMMGGVSRRVMVRSQ
jgi:hypothetical protein